MNERYATIILAAVLLSMFFVWWHAIRSGDQCKAACLERNTLLWTEADGRCFCGAGGDNWTEAKP